MQDSIRVKIDKSIESVSEEEIRSTARASRAKVCCIYFLQLFIAYILMLIVMTFNFGLFAATVLGMTIAYGLFGFIETESGTPFNPEADACCTPMED